MIKTHENVENFLQNDIRSKNKHFEIVLLKKLIYIYIYIIFDNNIVCVDKRYEFFKCTFIIKIH